MMQLTQSPLPRNQYTGYPMIVFRGISARPTNRRSGLSVFMLCVLAALGFLVGELTTLYVWVCVYGCLWGQSINNNIHR